MRLVHSKLRLSLYLDDTLMDEKLFDQAKIVIGRDPSCDFTIDNKLISGTHAKITREHGGYYVEDIGSTNGTFLNGRRISKEFLRLGSEITVGKHRITLTHEGESDFSGEADETILPLTDETINLSPSEAERLYQRAREESLASLSGELALVKGKGAPLKVRLTKLMTKVGAAPDADLTLKGFFAPTIAFHVEKSEEGFLLHVPPGSKKLKVNGNPAANRARLKDGDILTMGSTSIRFRLFR
ncbi:MAG: hypothetical protein C0608_05765 [Deltaproteobacteria bacterium]|nr:MAG: hypothetical protein C0608_05765 [Deltaproteobacteria bacterium]